MQAPSLSPKKIKMESHQKRGYALEDYFAQTMKKSQAAELDLSGIKFGKRLANQYNQEHFHTQNHVSVPQMAVGLRCF